MSFLPHTCECYICHREMFDSLRHAQLNAQVKDESHDDCCQREATAIQRIQELENLYRHYHVHSFDGGDACEDCGLDLRDPIHIHLAGKVKP